MSSAAEMSQSEQLKENKISDQGRFCDENKGNKVENGEGVGVGEGRGGRQSSFAMVVR